MKAGRSTGGWSIGSVGLVSILGMVSLFAPALRAAATEVEAPAASDGWTTVAPAFSDTAGVGSTPTLFYFTATWCGYCRQMERTTLADAGVRTQWAGLPRVKLDLDREGALAGRFEVRGVPAFLFVNARGEVLSRIEGATDVETFKRWLDEGRVRAVEAVKAAGRLQIDLVFLEEQARGDRLTRDKTTWTRLFVLASGRGNPAGRPVATDLLAECARKEPVLLVDGLAHADLAVRIVAAKLTQARVSRAEDFVFDPWETADVRQRQVGAARQTLEKMESLSK